MAWLTLQGPGEDPAYVFSPSTVTVYSTTDGGKSWASSVPFRIQAGYPDTPVFVDPQHGWMLIVLAEYHTSWSVEIRRTNDGGRTWELASRTEPHMDDPLYPDTPGGLPVNCIKNGISFVHQLVGWATGQCYDVQYPFLVVEALFLYATSDGGSTWAHRSLPIPEGLPANVSDLWYTNISPPVFFSGGAGYMTVTLRLQDDTVVELLYTTPDGGINWAGRTLPQGMWLLRFVTPSQGWVYAHEEDQLYATVDGGATWTAIGPYPERAALGSGDFVFADSPHGWISRGDRIDLTEDGGRTWLRFTPVLASTK